MAQIKIPGALAGATGEKTPDYAIAASFFKIATKHYVGQSNACGMVHYMSFSPLREDFPCK